MIAPGERCAVGNVGSFSWILGARDQRFESAAYLIRQVIVQ